MSSFAASERTDLCAVAEQVGPDAPTLCGEWTVRDLVVHLLVREGSLASVGIVVRPLRGLVDRASRRTGRQEFPDLVQRLRNGPPVWSPFAVPKLGAMLNVLEFFVHHEDIRRAQPQWQPRSLPRRTEDAIWKAAGHTGRGLVAKSGAGVGVVAERSDTGDRVTLWPSSSSVTVRGLPSEVTLYLFGRKAQAEVELDGAPEDVARLSGAGLGI
ncbi:MAG TPA: TIGR03085 family metal-binding protein [Marmoricola sp.]|nr:TIGR03085 family metal-binding protein [Marmoricola sp.]